MAEWGNALSRWSNPFAAGQRPPAPLPAGARRGRTAPARSAEDRARARLCRAGGAVCSRTSRPQSGGRASSPIATRWRSVAAANPNDSEASIFYALALAAAAPPTDKTYADQLKAGAILEQLLAAQPDHPGLAHYIIHSYDVPPLAERALDAARRYAKIAPSAPHALHMPSHTFTRVG